MTFAVRQICKVLVLLVGLFEPKRQHTLIRIFTGRISDSHECMHLHVGNEDSDQTAHKRSLI